MRTTRPWITQILSTLMAEGIWFPAVPAFNCSTLARLYPDTYNGPFGGPLVTSQTESVRLDAIAAQVEAEADLLVTCRASRQPFGDVSWLRRVHLARARARQVQNSTSATEG